MDYREMWKLQRDLVEMRRTGVFDSDVFFLLEHTPVFTLGRRGGRENLTVSEERLEQAGIPVVHVERGGNITHHGPGQLVGYPIVDLHRAKLKVAEYVHALEEVMIRTAARFGVQAVRNPLNRGVWAGSRKLGSIGIAIRRGITFHGFAFNVNTSLEPFCWINPCGLEGISMTSLERELSCRIEMDEVRLWIRMGMESVFRVSMRPAPLKMVQGLLHGAGTERERP
jgi:lipoate-protein ligase B